MASSVCGCEVFPAHAMSSFSLLPCRTSRPWRFEPSVHHPPGGMHRLPEIAHDHVSASASKPPPIKRQQNLTAGQSELDQNYSNSITPTEEPAFSTPSAVAQENDAERAAR